ncbi:TIR domain-containing protein [Candidatus Accumulibacter vicinus]|uniref:TIR domain-containing protein n=1 Tax=Candidatus Accumulibacter vicinus TaxID=2954382 RepID=A0A084Y2V2_9PROT|nr:TIR domain-containing protein [Candidatus Accumulibacter vicinus]KFB69046.1 MAG: hypothetical protein CAPSK01_001237 [Candidatus Accumulibacter vicinus]
MTSTRNASRNAARIFISYRRQDSEAAASRLAEDLRRHFADEQVFQDFSSIDPGADFVDAVQRGLDTCAAVVVVIGPDWLKVVDRNGRRRIDLPEDWVRHEVGESLRRPGVRVFPVLVGGADMPGVADLPGELQPLTRRQAFPLTVRHWPKDVAELVEHLRRVPGLDRPQHVTGLVDWLRKIGAGKGWRWSGVAVAVLAALGYWWFSSREPAGPQVTKPTDPPVAKRTDLPTAKPAAAAPWLEPDPLADKANALLQLVDRQRREVAEAAQKAAGDRDLMQKQLKAARSDDDRRAQQVALFEAQERLAVEQELAALYRKEIEGPQGVAALTASLGQANAAAKAGDLPQARAQYTAVIAALTTLQARPAALREQIVSQRDRSVQRLAGNWALDDCTKAAKFVVNGRSLQIAWPPFGDFEERVLSADPREVVSMVVSAGKYQGRLSGYAPTAKGLTIRSIAADGHSETLKRCD